MIRSNLTINSIYHTYIQFDIMALSNLTINLVYHTHLSGFEVI